MNVAKNTKFESGDDIATINWVIGSSLIWDSFFWRRGRGGPNFLKQKAKVNWIATEIPPYPSAPLYDKL